MYAGFGVLISGFDTLDEIANQQTDYMDKPIENQTIKEIVRVR